MAELNTNNVITLGGLSTFLNKLKTECFYTRGALDIEFAKYALKNGTTTESFKASELALYYDGNPISFNVGDRLLTISCDYDDTHHEVNLPLGNNGTILTSADFDYTSKANLINKYVFITNNSVSSQRSFVSDPLINKFRLPIIVQNLGDDIEIYVDAGTVQNPTSFKAYYLANPVGTVMYVGTSTRTTWSNTTGSVGMVSALPLGFYIVTKAVSGTNPYKECEFLCQPSLYGLYYCLSGDGFFCHFDNTDGYATIASGGGGGTGDYTEASDDEINGLDYN